MSHSSLHVCGEIPPPFSLFPPSKNGIEAILYVHEGLRLALSHSPVRGFRGIRLELPCIHRLAHVSGAVRLLHPAHCLLVGIIGMPVSTNNETARPEHSFAGVLTVHFTTKISFQTITIENRGLNPRQSGARAHKERVRVRYCCNLTASEQGRLEHQKSMGGEKVGKKFQFLM